MSDMIIESHLAEVKEALRQRIPVILKALGEEAEGNAITEVNKLVYDTKPSESYIRTGQLKKSIAHAVSEDSAYVGTNLKYAPYVELGTYRMKPRPFLRNAITEYRDDYKRIIEEGLK